MSHNLDEINAALKLGDRFLPPRGCRIELTNARVIPNIIVWVSRIEVAHAFREGTYLLWFLDSYGDGGQVVLSPPPFGWGYRICSVSSIPPTAPPFSKWLRP